nr:MAG TPA: hypothetical protein [Caudoviricetes sp.]
MNSLQLVISSLLVIQMKVEEEKTRLLLMLLS